MRPRYRRYRVEILTLDGWISVAHVINVTGIKMARRIAQSVVCLRQFPWPPYIVYEIPRSAQ